MQTPGEAFKFSVFLLQIQPQLIISFNWGWMREEKKASMYAICDLLRHFPPIHPLGHKLGGEINFTLEEMENKINS